MKKITMFVMLILIFGNISCAFVEKKELFRIKYKSKHEMTYSGSIFSLSKDYISLVMPNKYALYDLNGDKLWELSKVDKVYGEMAGNGLWHILEFQKRNGNEYLGYNCLLNKEGKVVWRKQIDASPSISWDGGEILLQKQADTEYAGFILVDKTGKEVPISNDILQHETYTYLTGKGNLIVLSSMPGKGGNIRKISFCTADNKLGEYQVEGKYGYGYLDCSVVFTDTPDDYYIAIFQDDSDALHGQIVYGLYSFNKEKLLWKSNAYVLNRETWTYSLSGGGRYFCFFDEGEGSVIFMNNSNGKVLWEKRIQELGNNSVSHIKLTSSGKYILIVGDKDIFIFDNQGRKIYQGKKTRNVVNIALSEEDKRLYLADETHFYAYDVSGLIK